jgi:hypothetical protein
VKSISASIVILAAAVLLAGGSHVAHGQTRVFVQLVGCAAGLLGFGVWFVALQDKGESE